MYTTAGKRMSAPLLVISRGILAHARTAARPLSASSTNTQLQHHDGDEQINDVPTISQQDGRNPKLTAVIREGMGSLNSSALFIHRSGHTKKPVFSAPGDDDEDETFDPRRLYEQSSILAVAQEYMEIIAQKEATHPFMCATGDPITLLSCRINTTCSDAILYWSLPYSVLTQLTSHDQRRTLEGIMAERVAENKDFLARIHAVLSRKARLRLRLQLAAQKDIMDYLYSMENDDDPSTMEADSDSEERVDEGGSDDEEDEDESGERHPRKSFDESSQIL